jgi:hypothetical protein
MGLFARLQQIAAMFESLDPLALFLRFAGAFYVFAGIVAGRAALVSAVLDSAIAGIAAKSVNARERVLSLWLIASAWLVFASGALLMVLAREAVWAFMLSALTQAFYLAIAAPYYFDTEDPPDAQGRRQTTNAFYLYFVVTLIVIWASGHGLQPLSGQALVLQIAVWAALMGFAAYMIWQALWACEPAAARKTMALPALTPEASDEDVAPDPPDYRGVRAVKIMTELYCDPCWAVDSDHAGSFPPDALALTPGLTADLLDWQDRFDALAQQTGSEWPQLTPEQRLAHEDEGLALAARVKVERPDLTVYVWHAGGFLMAETEALPMQWRRI